MPVAQYDTNFNFLSPPEFILTLGNFADSLIVHEFFKDNWPEWLTHATELKGKVALYNDAVKVYDAEGGRKNLQVRDDCRQDAHVSTVFMCQYVVMRSVSEKRPDLLKTIAMKLKSRSPKVSSKNIVQLSVPENLVLKHGRDSGAIVVSYSKNKFAGSYQVQVCEGDPAVEENWKTIGHYKTCREEFKGYQPGTRLYVRVRCLGTGDPGPYSQPVSIIVI